MKPLLSILILGLLAGCAGIQPRYHTVRTGETLESIAKRYSVPLDSLKDKNERLVENGIKAGRKIYIPFERNPAWNEVDEVIEKAEAEQKEDKAGVAPLDRSNHKSEDDITSVIPSRKEKKTKDLLSGVSFRWPVSGSISSPFGMRRGSPHEGIDIAAVRGTPVRSARSGHVIYCGNGINGYGNMVIVRHSDSFATVYAHLSRINAKKGQFITRNQMLGRVGSTGHSSGPHLHFEIRNGRLPVDPLDYLPGQFAANASRRTVR